MRVKFRALVRLVRAFETGAREIEENLWRTTCLDNVVGGS
jgi:hypothetical protein